MNNSLKLMSWNVQSGGFEGYPTDQEIPIRGSRIKSFIDDAHTNENVEAVSLVDAYRWDEVYGDDAGIATHLGYTQARFVPLNDDRLDRDNGRGIGVVFATDERVETSRILDLDNRQGLSTILDIGKYGLQVATVYLDDLDPSVRKKQIRALIDDLEPDVPTVLVGDFNSLRPEMTGASLINQTKDLAIRSLAKFIPKENIRRTIVGMNKRTEVPLIESFGFGDADHAEKRPTAPSILPALGVDYVFYNDTVHVNNFEVVPTKKSSDHSAIIAELSV